MASEDPAIAAVVAQVPVIDGWHRGRGLRQRLTWDITWRTAQFTAAALRDIVHDRAGRAPYLVPVVDEPGHVAVFTEPDAKAVFDELGGESVGWRNALAPRMIFGLPRYRTGTAERLHMPVLMCLADRDLQASATFAAKLAARMPNVEIHHYPVGHFDVYLEPLRNEIACTQAEFLHRQLSR